MASPVSEVGPGGARLGSVEVESCGVAAVSWHLSDPTYIVAGRRAALLQGVAPTNTYMQTFVDIVLSLCCVATDFPRVVCVFSR